MVKTFTATKTRSNRPGWSITFRHPLRHDTQGRIGLKVRRGLNTDIEAQADALVEQMNKLLHDPTWWNATRRQEAERQFDPAIVRAFFDDLQLSAADPEQLREQYLELPRADQGYARVLFVGTTGAGKTTLLRQLIGSDPDIDRFPSIAPAKTTIADIEVIAGGTDFRAIVTFFTEFQVQAYVEECVLDAAIAVQQEQPEFRIADRFLNHRDQKFRLSYILGSWGAGPAVEKDAGFDDDDEDDEEQPVLIPDDEAVTDAEKRSNREAVGVVIGRIQKLATDVSSEISQALGVVDTKLVKDDQDAYLELMGEEFERELYLRDEFHNLVQDVLDMIRVRFERLKSGTLHHSSSGWPMSWTFKTQDRAEFIHSIRWFSSNHWPQFGLLLTPIVNGMRLLGPLYPEFANEHSKLVLIDGQGLGHTPDDATSLTTHITRKFAEVDVVLLVDNAQQPMQAAPLSVLKSLAISGHENKLAIAFTHFDLIRGRNLQSMADRRAHVMASVVSALASLQDTVGTRIVRGLERGIDDRCFMLSGTQRRVSGRAAKAASYMTTQLTGLIEFFERAAVPVETPESTALVYDPVGISFAVQSGASRFNHAWRARLGLASYASINKEHWTRVKALSKRIAGALDDEYDTLRPVADLQTSLLEAISRYLDAPASEPEEDPEQRATTRARQIVAAGLTKAVGRRLVDEQIETWRVAYNDRGHGSASRRADLIAGICAAAAPVPDAIMAAQQKVFLKEMSSIVFSAIGAVGGKLEAA